MPSVFFKFKVVGFDVNYDFLQKEPGILHRLSKILNLCENRLKKKVLINLKILNNDYVSIKHFFQ